MRPKKKVSLAQLIERVNWMMLEPMGSRPRLGLNEVSVGFFKSDTDVKKSTEVRIRIGQKVLEAANWKAGDKIFVQNDPDDLFLFKLFNTGGTGWTLSKETNSPNCRIHVKWPHKKTPIETRKPMVVKHYILKNHIVFHATSELDIAE